MIYYNIHSISHHELKRRFIIFLNIFFCSSQIILCRAEEIFTSFELDEQIKRSDPILFAQLSNHKNINATALL